MNDYLVSDILYDLSLENTRLYNSILEYLILYKADNLNELLSSLSINTTTLFQEFLLYCSCKEKYFSYFPQICKLNLDQELTIELLIEEIFKSETDLRDKYSLYWLAKRFTFTHTCTPSTLNKVQESYKYILEENQKLFNLTLNEELDTVNTKKRIFIFITQYLSYAHSPSKLATIWARAFKELGQTVLIISCIPFPYRYPFYKQSAFSFNKIMQIADTKEIEDNILAIEIGGEILLNNIYENLLINFNINQNDEFLLVGESCLHFDILPHKNKYILPTSFPQKSISSTAKTYILNKKLDLLNINNESMDYLQGANDYTDEENLTYKKIEIESNKEINLAIIGNRLHIELNNEFWNSIDSLIKEMPTVKLYFIGQISKDIIPLSLLKNIELVGYQNDLSDFLKNIHFYINPDREGGGQSGVLAIKMGIPIITLPKGDVYSAIDKKYHIKSLSEIKTFIKKYIENKEFRNKINNYNYELSKKFNNSPDIILQAAKKILDIKND